MKSLQDDPRINQKAATQLAALGVAVEVSDAGEVHARLPQELYLDNSAKIFNKLAKLAVGGYDTKTLSVRTCDGQVNVRFTIN
ncbi:MAG: hypothetical protein ACJ74Q_15485 [Pyrinomonadaceae bacterium]